MSVTGKRGVGVPVILMHDGEGTIVTVECKNGDTYRGFLDETEDNMNCILKDATRTDATSRPSAHRAAVPRDLVEEMSRRARVSSGFLGGLATPPRARHPSAEDSRPRRVSGKC